MRWLILLLVALPLLAAGGARATTTAQPTAAPPTCADFSSQAAAQAYLRANPGAAAALNQSAGGPTGIACQLAITDGTYPPGSPIDLVVVPLAPAATASPTATPRQIATVTPPPPPTATPVPSPAATRPARQPARTATPAGTAAPRAVTALDVATGKVRCDRVAVANRSVSATGCDGVGSFGGFLPEGCAKTVWSANGDRVTIAYPVARVGTRPEVTPPAITGCAVGKSGSRGVGKKPRPTAVPTP